MTSEELVAAVRHLQELPTDREETNGTVELRVHPSFIRMCMSTDRGMDALAHLLSTGQVRWTK